MYTETERSPGWRPWSSLEKLKTSYNVPSDGQGSRSDNLSVFVDVFCCGRFLPIYFSQIYLTAIESISSYGNPSVEEATLTNMGKSMKWIQQELTVWPRHTKTKQNKIVCIFYGIYFMQTNVLTQNLVKSRSHEIRV